MSIDYKAIAMVGVYFDQSEDVTEFLNRFDIEEADDIPDMVSECLNCFSGEGYILGYEVSLGEPLEPYIERWNKQFPDSGKTPKGILEAAVW